MFSPTSLLTWDSSPLVPPAYMSLLLPRTLRWPDISIIVPMLALVTVVILLVRVLGELSTRLEVIMLTWLFVVPIMVPVNLICLPKSKHITLSDRYMVKTFW